MFIYLSISMFSTEPTCNSSIWSISTTTNLCCSATSPHLTHLWYIVNHYHPRIFDPMICLSSIMSRYFLSILNGNHVMSYTFYYYVNNYRPKTGSLFRVSLVIIALLSVLARVRGMFTVTPTLEIYPKAR